MPSLAQPGSTPIAVPVQPPSSSPTPTGRPELTTAAIAAQVKASLVGPGNLVINDLASLEAGGPNSLTFIRSGKFANQWAASKAAAALVSEGLEVHGHDPATRALLIVEDADLAMIEILKLFLPPTHQPAPGAHPSATIDPTARIAPTARIGPNCTVGPGTIIADHCTLHPSVTLGANVTIGPGTTLFPGVVIYDRCTIGAQCILHSNAVIGADGFGYRPDPQGRGLIKIPHVGTVQIGNAVEIGANSAVDRGKFGPTIVGDGTKIDNLCQIGHNARIGRACIICGVTGIAGSVVVEDGVIIAGQVGIADGHRIGARAVISAMSGVMCDVPAGAAFFGCPAGPHKDQMRSAAALRKLPDYMKTLKRLEKQNAKEEHPTP